jgi:hypothetical protein
MFVVVAHTDEYIAGKAAFEAINPDDNPTAYQAAFEAAHARQYRCCGVYETEAEACSSFHDDPKHYDPVTWRKVAYLFIAGDATAGGRFVLYAGDNGWELASSSPEIAVGLFATADEALNWGLTHGFGDEQVIELDVAHVERVAA